MAGAGNRPHGLPHDIFCTLTVDAVILGLSDRENPPSASLIEAARKLMADNSCNLQSLIDWRSNGRMDLSQLPTFPDDDRDDEAGGQQATTGADPLRKIVPFANK